MEIKAELRPCLVDDKKALFHRWNEVRQVVPPSSMIGGHGGGVIAQTFGIVEYEDGSVKECYPYKIRFLDNKHEEFCFKE